MQEVALRLQNLEESATIAMSQKSRELKAKGVDVINLSLGEPDFNTPDFIKESAKKAIDDNFSKYTPVNGYEDLRAAVCTKLKRDNNLDYTPNQIVVSTGAKQCLANIMLSVINPGDEVIIPAPYWVTYVEIVKLAEGIPVIVETSIDNDFKITAQQLENAITPKTKMLLYSSPCNPTGSVYTEQELKSLVDVLKNKDILIVSDEIYEHINFDSKHHSIAQFEEVKDKTIVVNGLSKAFAMTGWRLGYMASPQWIASACNKMQGQFTSGTNSITQRAAITALLAPASSVDYMVTEFAKRRELVYNLIKDIEGIKINKPSGAFYLFPEVDAFFGLSYNDKTIKDADDLSLYLLEEAHVATVSGGAFGSPKNIRFSYAASEKELTEAMSRIKAALQKLS
jgi:aspartate aminotransferase